MNDFLKNIISKGQHIIDIPGDSCPTQGNIHRQIILSLKALGKFKRIGQKQYASGSQEVIRMLPSGRCQLPGIWLFKGSELMQQWVLDRETCGQPQNLYY